MSRSHKLRTEALPVGYAWLDQGACQHCHIDVPKAVANRVLSGASTRCPQCHRLLEPSPTPTRRAPSPEALLRPASRGPRAAPMRTIGANRARGSLHSAENRRREIQRLFERRGVNHLVHFTRLENLSSVIADGALLTREALEDPAHCPVLFSDDQRLDGRKDAVNLSIEFPNHRMFYKKRQESHTRPSDWVIIRLCSALAWELDCAFCPGNAASGTYSGKALRDLRSVESLSACFAEKAPGPGAPARKDLRIPERYPTDPQAEVLALEAVRLDYLEAIVFFDRRGVQNWRVASPSHRGFPVAADRQMFAPRDDYLHWTKRETPVENEQFFATEPPERIQVPISAYDEEDDSF